MQQPNTQQPQHRRQLRNYLLDRKLQLGYALVIVVVSAMLSGGLGYFWYGEMRSASRLVEVQALGSLDDADARAVGRDLAQQDHRRLAVLVGFGLIVAMVLGGYGIVFTHKVAGPLFKVQRYLREMKEGRLPDIHDLRRGDQLREFWTCFRETYAALRDQAATEAASLTEAIVLLEDGATSGQPQGQQALDILRTLRDRKQASIQPAENPRVDHQRVDNQPSANAG